MSAMKFGTDGWRAVIAREFTFDNIKTVCQGIACYIKSMGLAKNGVVVGFDNRFLSEQFAAECARVLTGNGIKVYQFAYATPTPVAAYAIRLLEAAGAVMITASHNPPEYNGIKFIPEYAGPALPDVTDAIEDEVSRIIENGRIYELDLKEAVTLDLLKEIEVDKEYTGQLLRAVNPEYIKANPVKVVVDPMYGAGIGYLDKILIELGCEVKTINNYRDTMFGGSMPEPTDSLLADLKRAVVNYKADVGLALDGDADRFGIIDRDGDFITPNQFGYLLFDHLLKTRTFRGPICRSIATTHRLDQIARENGLAVIETPVGFKYIGEGMREKGCMMGLEESGGLTVFGHIPEKDGILACLLAVEILALTGQTFKELMAESARQYGENYSVRVDIKTSYAEKEMVKANLKDFQPKTLAGIKVDRSNEIEGRQFILEDGSWVLIRPSGTEAVFRIYIETDSEERLQEIKNEVLTSLGLH